MSDGAQADTPPADVHPNEEAQKPPDPPPIEAPAPDPPPSTAPLPEQAVTAPVALAPIVPPAPPARPAGAPIPEKKLGWWGRMKQRVRDSVSPSGAVANMLQAVAQKAADDFVDKKVVEIRATADEFTREKVNEIKVEAHMLISYIEAKIDEKINEIERKLDERIAKEMEWRLRSLILTLVFVFAMTLLSLGYFAIKKHMGY